MAVSKPIFRAEVTDEFDAQRQVNQRLHDLQRLLHQRRFGLVGVDRGDTRIDVEDVSTRRHLGQSIPDHRFKIAGLHLSRQLFAARGIDALADHRERPVKADDVGARGG